MSEEPQPKKKLLSLKGWWWKLPLILIGLIGLLSGLGAFGPGGLPTCESSNAKSTLSNAFDQSQFARSLNLSTVQVQGAKELAGSNETQRLCVARISMNNGNTVPVNFVMTKQQGGQFLLRFEVQQ